MGIALNAANDMFAQGGSIQRVGTGAQVVQSVRSRLLQYFGEWFLETSTGVKYFEEIFTKPADIGTAESLLKATIIQTPGIATLESFEIEFDSTQRLLSVSFEATTIYGDAENITINLPV